MTVLQSRNVLLLGSIRMAWHLPYVACVTLAWRPIAAECFWGTTVTALMPSVSLH